MRVLVTGGAGYIGSHVSQCLARAAHDIAVIDDLSTGNERRLDVATTFFRGTVLDLDFVNDAIRTYSPDAVIHIAAKKSVDESVQDPLLYYRENVVGLQNVTSAMVSNGVQALLFSSSAAVYGEVPTSPVTELTDTRPSSPYGHSKLMCEQIIRDAGIAHGLSWAALRYFNVAGSAHPDLADRGENNLIPKVFRAITSGIQPSIFGDSYPTSDGTCVRDYIHVSDVADAHVRTLEDVVANQSSEIFNIGTGEGSSVLEVMSAIRTVTGIDFSTKVCAPRAGDPAEVVADPSKIRSRLRWEAQHDLVSAIESAWQGWSARGC